MLIQSSEIGTIAFVILCVMGLYYWLLIRMGILEPKQADLSPANDQPLSKDLIPLRLSSASQNVSMSLPPEVESSPQEEDLEDMTGVEFLDDDSDSLLLKEAERVVEQIQDTVVHIASNPPNIEEVTSKIKAIVSPYKLFLDTEYYDSINTYIALALERDCAIILSTEQLQSLWN